MTTTPRYEIGRAVRAVGDLLNDGSHPGAAEQAVLVDAGALGEIIKIGAHVETNATVYLVEFGERVVGCLESELAPA
jgi:nitrogen fixation protein NifZ